MGMGGQMQVAPDPAMQALLDSLPTRTMPFALIDVAIPNSQPPQVQNMVVCVEHQQPVCDVCDVNYTPLNYMQQFMKNAPPEAVPPPPNVQPPPQRAEQIKQIKEAGNTAFKAGNIPGAINNYSRSADMALSRPPWEVAAISRDETAIALCNRSAAFAAAGAWANALADADAVISLKRPWTKGHFRRARALVGLGRFEDAQDAIVDGLQFEPDEKDLNAYLLEVGELARKRDAGEPLDDPSDEKFSPLGPASGAQSPSKSGAATPNKATEEPKEGKEGNGKQA
ncbi:hypothetical protein CspeluHIS016_0900260 [Cutaneotrichosporon spelunceum]|uniref:TPR-like protein n=1 Tax=Cutaneotrichosporon spelunceum TaxID=1672016 RepID=A0AAD3U079_9TREE|nr:hypothetical protein CspeluHIS016_0900260 [Cutaneotrichosporon spelunceum]